MNFGWNCFWNVKHIRNGKVIWTFDDHNILVNEGAKALIDTLFRATDSLYFVDTNFYIGLYRGTISKSTILATVPGEPAGNGYGRILCERSAVGWPTIEIDDGGDWRVVSKELTWAASGGNIGPLDGAFISTSSNVTGVLIGAIAFGVQRTILSGDSVIAQLRAKIT